MSTAKKLEIEAIDCCPRCDREVGAENLTYALSDGYVCVDCYSAYLDYLEDYFGDSLEIVR